MGGPCCPGKPGEPHCPAANLYCQVRGWFEATINDTYCLEIGACGHTGQSICNHTYAKACQSAMITWCKFTYPAQRLLLILSSPVLAHHVDSHVCSVVLHRTQQDLLTVCHERHNMRACLGSPAHLHLSRHAMYAAALGAWEPDMPGALKRW